MGRLPSPIALAPRRNLWGVHLGVEGNTVQIGLTDAGRALGAQLRSEPLFAELSHRSDLMLKAVGSMSATRLKEFVYQTVPEIIDMKWGEEISF
jgi:hypothetical protein